MISNDTNVRQQLEMTTSVATLAAAKAAPDVLERFISGASTHRFVAHTGRKLLLTEYDIQGGEPHWFDTLTCVELSLGRNGLESLWEIASTDQVLRVGHCPVEIAQDGVFLWHMVDTSLVKDPNRVTCSMLARTPKNPLKVREPGHIYLMEESLFRQQTGSR